VLLTDTVRRLQLELKDMHVTFSVRRGDFQNPNSADIRVYNLSNDLAQYVMDNYRVQDKVTAPFSKSLMTVSLSAGYDANFGLLFNGEVKQARTGRQDQRDTFVDITAADGDEAYNFAVSARSLAAGAKPSDAVSALIQTMAQGAQGVIPQGNPPELTARPTLRGEVFYGATRDRLRQLAYENNCTWSIQDGEFTLIPFAKYLPGPIPVISVATGLIGVPEQTDQGLEMRTLLNPNIKVGQAVKLDNKSAVNLFRYSLDAAAQSGDDASNLALSRAIHLNQDGLYYVMCVNHVGDNRGEEWYSDLICMSIDATINAGVLNRAAVFPASAVNVIPGT
jgi:hypothetical protein